MGGSFGSGNILRVKAKPGPISIHINLLTNRGHVLAAYVLSYLCDRLDKQFQQSKTYFFYFFAKKYENA